MEDVLFITEKLKQNALERVNNTPERSSLQRSIKATQSLHNNVNENPLLIFSYYLNNGILLSITNFASSIFSFPMSDLFPFLL